MKMQSKTLLVTAMLAVTAGCSSSSDPDGVTTGGTTTGTTTTGTTTTGTTTTGTTTTGTTTTGTTTTGTTTTGTTTTGTTTTGTTTAGGTSDLPTGNISSAGFITAAHDVSNDEVSLSAGFIGSDTAITATQLLESIQPTLDTCVVTEFTAQQPPTTSFEIPTFDNPANPISAGETINFSTSGNTYSELTRTTLAGFIGYLPAAGSIAGPMPNDLIMDIPGDVFPAFSAVAIPRADPIVLTTPASGEQTTPTTVFTWTAGSNANAVVEISVSSPINFTTPMSKVVECKVSDDGEFSFPAATQTEMGDSFAISTVPVLDLGVSISRVVTTYSQQGSAVLVLRGTSSD